MLHHVVLNGHGFNTPCPSLPMIRTRGGVGSMLKEPFLTGLSKVEAAWCATHLTQRTRTIDREQINYFAEKGWGGGVGGGTDVQL